MLSAYLKDDALWVLRNGQYIYSCGLSNLKNKSVQVNGTCVRVIGEACEGHPTCFAYIFDEDGRLLDIRNELL